MIYHQHLSNLHPQNIDDTATVHSHVWIGDEVQVPAYCKIQAFAFIPNGVRLGEGVFVGPHVCFTNDKRPPNWVFQETIVCDYASIGAGSVILPGLRIGKRAKIGAGSVVTKDVPDGETWFGNPATKYEYQD